jgi:sugar phosphate isomerase/epimerase
MNTNHRSSRRSFLKKGMVGLAGLSSFNLVGCLTKEGDLPNLGLQLYTVRNEIDRDIRGALSRVAGMGFSGVESAFFPDDISIEDAGKLLKEFNLNVFSAHIELPVNQVEKDNMERIAEAYDCDRMIWHGWPEDSRYKTEEGTRELIEIYNEANHFARSRGLCFGLHNHWWEYEKQNTGIYPFEILLNEVDKDIFFEIDTYWATVAGHDAAGILERFGRRAPLIHIKDGPAKYSDSLDEDEPDPMVALGKGSMNIPAIATAGRGSLEWIIVELDVVKSDVFEAVKESYEYMVSNHFAKGMK